MRPIRLLLLTFLVVLATLGLLAAGLYGLARVSWTEQKLAGWLSGELRLPVKFDALALGYFPEPWLELTGLTVAAGSDAGAGVLIETERLTLELPWRTVFGRAYAVDRLALQAPRVHLSRDAKAANWEVLSARIAELMAGESIAWSLGALELDEGSVGYRDQTTGTVVEASGIGLSGADIAPGQFFPLKARVALQVQGYVVHVGLDGQASVDPDHSAYAFQPLGFTGWVGGGTLPLAGVKLAAQAEAMHFDGAAGTAAVQGLVFDGLGVKATGQLQATGLNASPVATFSLDSAPFAPRTIGFTLGKPLPETQDPSALGQASVSLQGAWSTAGLRLDDLHGTLDDSRFSGSLRWPADGAPPTVRLHVDKVNLDRYLAPASASAGASSPQAAVEALMRGLETVTMDAEITVDLAQAAGVTAHELKVTLVPDETPPTPETP
jgi:hypothetical protein